MLSIFTLSACSLNGNKKQDKIAEYTNQAPNNIQVNMEVGYSHSELVKVEVVNNDVYINDHKGDEWNDSYFAHLKDGSYEYYKKNVKYNGEWEDFVPVTTDKENPSTYDAICAFNGVISTMIASVFNIQVVNGYEYSGTGNINGEETYIYNVNDSAYWVSETAKMNMQILPKDGIEPDWSVEVKSYQTISAFTDSPSF